MELRLLEQAKMTVSIEGVRQAIYITPMSHGSVHKNKKTNTLIAPHPQCEAPPNVLAEVDAL
jgi:hypothetical protein